MKLKFSIAGLLAFFPAYWIAGVVNANAASDTLRISLKQAMDTARTAAVSVQLAHSRSLEKDAKVDEMRGALLPRVGATATDAIRSVDLPAQGFSPDALGFPAGASFPSLIKPFNSQDARINGGVSLLDLSAWKRYQASRREQESGDLDEQAAAEDAASTAASAYLALARARALISAREMELALVQQLDSLTRAQKQAGAVAQIEVLRAQGQLSSSQSALSAARGEEERSRYVLLRILGMDMGVYPALTDTLSVNEDPVPTTTEVSLTQALSSRPEVAAAEKQADAARAEMGALNAGLLPTLNLYGDYGLIGRRLNGNAEWTEDVALQLSWNFWDGGQREGRRAVQHERLRQAEIRQRDARSAIEQDVRESSAWMRSSREQEIHALERVQFAEQETKLAEERFQAGGSGNLEVILSQNNLSLAHDGYIDALYGYNRARLAFYRAAHRLSDF